MTMTSEPLVIHLLMMLLSGVTMSTSPCWRCSQGSGVSLDGVKPSFDGPAALASMWKATRSDPASE
jgi:hypothetical protein